ncbi:FAD-binding oxidoreductase [Paractinoplanes durhamensis]|uniref:Oxidoreductase n=2 Tax=Paractinoplanes durhamensis TaxID=113563 RepID=A0ABQ3Z3H5_9ACTN|nr:FAD-binding protein [Actinoplanes durhamensis]GIE04374.1 oxidoreductase [Actinoplanes durhamensis]
MRLFQRGFAGYEEARVGRVFNQRRPDRYPAAVLLAESAEDVAEGVRMANQRGWTVSVRSGGHSWAAWSVRDDALLIDLEGLDAIAYDEESGIAVAGPAVRGGRELAPFLTERGRAFPGGHCPTVGIGGFLLQGGQGWNSRSKGWACESVVAVDVVTADGSRLHCDATENSDLYWAARGAGPGFPAIVTAFHLQTYEAYPHLFHDTWSFSPDDGEQLLSWMHDLLPKLDRRVEPVIAATRLPNVPLDEGVPHPGTVLLLHTTAMVSSPQEAEDLFRIFDSCPLPVLGHVRGETSLAEESAAQDEQSPEGHRYAVDCTWTDAPADRLAGPLLRLWRELDTEHSFSIWYGWAPNRPLPDMAFSVEGNVYIATYVIYTDPADDEKYRTWVHERTAAIAAEGGVGVYLGDTDFTGRQDRFLSDANYARLEEIRDRRDPQRRFASYLAADPGRLNVHG